MSFIMGDRGCWMIDHIGKTIYKPDGRESQENPEPGREWIVLEKRSKGVKKSSKMDIIETVCNLVEIERKARIQKNYISIKELGQLMRKKIVSEKPFEVLTK